MRCGFFNPFMFILVLCFLPVLFFSSAMRIVSTCLKYAFMSLVVSSQTLCLPLCSHGTRVCFCLLLFASDQCLDYKDLELGYKVHSLVEVGENWRLLGNSFQQSIY